MFASKQPITVTTIANPISTFLVASCIPEIVSLVSCYGNGRLCKYRLTLNFNNAQSSRKINTDCDHMHGLEEHVDTPVVTLSVDPTDTEWGSNTIITTWTTWQVSSSNPYTRPPLLFFCYSAVGDMQSFTKDLVDGLFQAVVDLPATLGIIKVQSEPVFA